MESIIIGIVSSGLLFFVGKYFLNKKNLENKIIENDALKSNIETQEKVHSQEIKNIKTGVEVQKKVAESGEKLSSKKNSVRDKVNNTPDGETYNLKIKD